MTVTRLAYPGFLGVMAIAAIMTTAPAAQAQLAAAPPPPLPLPHARLGHFLCYVVDGRPVDQVVGTQDQFDIADKNDFEHTHVRQAIRLCNPVEKRHRGVISPIPDRRAHLTLYLAVPPNITPTRSVRVSNQFGRQKLLTYNPIVLATPTMKNNEGFPEDLDHYKCYRAYGRSASTFVNLRDQFQIQQRVRVGRPVLFCNPSRKIHDGVAYGVNNATDHLVCYQIERRPFERGVTTVDQFGAHDLKVSYSDLLCTPTKKIDFVRLQ